MATRKENEEKVEERAKSRMQRKWKRRKQRILKEVQGVGKKELNETERETFKRDRMDVEYAKG